MGIVDKREGTTVIRTKEVKWRHETGRMLKVGKSHVYDTSYGNR